LHATTAAKKQLLAANPNVWPPRLFLEHVVSFYNNPTLGDASAVRRFVLQNKRVSALV